LLHEHVHMHDSQRFFLDALERYERPLIRFAHSYTQDLEEARDVVQDVFLKLSQHITTLDTDRLAPWLFTVCKNRALDHQRKHSRLIVMETDTLDHEAAAGPQPGDEMQSRETAATLRSLIETLPTRQREAVQLKFISDLDYKEISQVMKTSIGNVGYLIHHGVQALRSKWQELEDEPHRAGKLSLGVPA
jgi:RNA polymerase sigma factor (sigma-70 family)